MNTNTIDCLDECRKTLESYQEAINEIEKATKDALHEAEKEFGRQKIKNAWSALSADQRRTCQRSVDMPSAIITCAQQNPKFVSMMAPTQVAFDMSCARIQDVHDASINNLASACYKRMRTIIAMGQPS